jgi:putative ABC transport system permease protein
LAPAGDLKLGVRNIPRRKAQTTLIIIGLMLATLIISAALGTGDTLNRSVNSAVLRTLGPLDEIVLAATDEEGNASISSILTETMPESNVEAVRAAVGDSDNVDAVAGILLSQSPVLNLGDRDPSNLQSIDDVLQAATASNPTVFIAGLDQTTIDDIGGMEDLDGNPVDVSTLGDNGVYVGKATADDLGLAVGDTIAYISGNEPYLAEIRGVLPDTVLTGSINPGTASMLMELGRLQEITGQEGRVSGIGVSNAGGTREGLEYTEDVTALLRTELADEDLGVVTIKQDNVEQAELIANIFVTFFVVFGLFSIGVGVLLIVLIFTMLAAERRAEMGMERAVGAQRRQLIQQFLAEGAGYILLSGLIGTGLGVLATWAIAQGFSGLAEGLFSIELYVTPRSLVIAYSLGVVITFLAVAVSSWRVSRLNVVAAIRDIPDSYNAHRNRKQLFWGIVMLAAGVLLTFLGMNVDQQAPFTIGMTLIPLGIAAIVTFFGASSRLVLTIAGIYLLLFWLLPSDLFTPVFGEMNGNIEMFFVSGICIVAASTLVIVQNLDTILSVITRYGGALRSMLPSVRLAVAYPGANKGRAGMTIAMFSLIVFSLVMVAAINNNFADAFLSKQANAGMEIRVDVPDENPLADFQGTLEQEGVDTSQFRGIGKMVSMDNLEEVKDEDGEWLRYIVSGMDEGYLDSAELEFQARGGLRNGRGHHRSAQDRVERHRRQPCVRRGRARELWWSSHSQTGRCTH